MRRKTTIGIHSRFDLVYIGLLASIYVITGKIGLFFALEHGKATLVWPPAGIALAALILYGYRFWPGIFIGTFLINLTLDVSPVVTIAVMIGNVLGALLGTYLLKRVIGFRPALERLPDALGMIIFAALLSTLISPTCGVISQLLTDQLPWEVFGTVWLTWWMGDAIGVLLITPVILSWVTEPSIRSTPQRFIEAGSLLFLTVLVSIFVYSEFFHKQAYLPLSYTIFPFVIWAALRFGQRGATTIAYVGTSIAVWGAANGSGPFFGKSIQESLLLLQSFMGIVAITALILAAIITERKHVQEALQESEARYRSLINDVLDSSTIGTLILDATLHVVWMNQTFERYFGLSRDTLIGKDIWPLMTRQINQIFADPEFFAAKIGAAYAQNNYVENFECHLLPGDQHEERWLEHWSQPIKTGLYAGGRIEHYYDITARKRAEEALRASEEKYKVLFQIHPIGIALVDQHGQIIEINTALERMLALPFAEQTHRSVDSSAWHFLRPDGTLMPPAEFPGVCALRQQSIVQDIEMGLPHDNGSITWLNVTAAPIPIEGYGAIITYHDITARKRSEDVLRENQRFIQGIADASPSILYLFDLVTQCNIYSNRELGTILGYTQQEIQAMGMNFFYKKMHPDDLALLGDHVRQVMMLEDNEIIEHDYRLKDAHGEWRWLSSRETIFTRTPEREPHIVLGTAQDITVRKRAEEQIKSSLREKEVLLKEIHHRVKNNLQIISSLFRLQSRHTHDPHALAMFRESQDRVQSMALVHQKLYQSADLARIDFAEYLQSLAHSLLRSYQVNTHAITLTIMIDDIFLDIDQAIPCGLIINELVSNSLKYAFPDHHAGEIQIELRRTTNQHLRLMVRDNGIGLPLDIDLATTRTLGLQLASTLTNQLGGSITIERHHGTTFIIEFMPTNHEEREKHHEYSEYPGGRR